MPSSRPQTCACARNNFNRFRKESSLPTEAGNSYPGAVRVGRAGVAGAEETQKHNLHGALVPAGLEHLNQGPPSSGCRSNLSLILHAPGHWPAATDPHSDARSLLPLRSGGFQRTVCAMETVARGGRNEGRRLEGVCDPRGARAGGRRVGGRRRRAWKQEMSFQGSSRLGPDLENSRCPRCGSRSSQPMALRGTESRRGKKLGTRVSLVISGALGTRSRGLQEIDASACYPPARCQLRTSPEPLTWFPKETEL